ncbi:hypothetical protein MNBD_NITROSPINAE04-230 [hydrothermal vent metagenome]|uniref:Uncharacterized protein n=1 Tax=hydrothermal vent metagenome TaxID=652676 RepID=A0A3B1C3Y8_9ZZZZ
MIFEHHPVMGVAVVADLCVRLHGAIVLIDELNTYGRREWSLGRGGVLFLPIE